MIQFYLHLFYLFFYVLLTVHLITVFVNNQLEAQLFFLIFVYSNSLHVSSNPVLILRRVNCINTTSRICHSLLVAVWYAGLDGTCIPHCPPRRVTYTTGIDTMILLMMSTGLRETCRELE